MSCYLAHEDGRMPTGRPNHIYSDAEKAEALMQLALNGNDAHKTGKQLGISYKSLLSWKRATPKLTMASVEEAIEKALSQLLAQIPQQMAGKDWAIAVGILTDKWLLLRGQPTSRTESISRKVHDLDDEQYSAAVAEAERILAEATRSGVAEGGTN